MKWLRATVICAIMAAVGAAAWSAPDPVKDCPTGLVCLTEEEATRIEKTMAWMDNEIRTLRDRLPRRFGAMYSVGGLYSPALDQPFGLSACAGFYLGPVNACAGVHNDVAELTFSYVKRF